MDVPLVKFIEQHCSNPFEKRIVEELPREDAFRENAQARVAADAPVEAYVIADFSTQFPSPLIGDARCRGPRRHAPRLEHYDVGVIRVENISREQCRRNARRFAGAGLGNEDEGAVGAGRVNYPRERCVDGKGKHLGKTR
jgi:hypothetical protein